MQGQRGMEPFLEPVPVADYPDYPTVVAHPLSLSEIELRLREYASVGSIVADVALIFANCRTYNEPVRCC